jgi:CRP-like cAMP-binding protein
MRGQAYVGTTKRTFRQAVRHLLETEYGVLGSRRVLEMLARDLHELAELFYPAPERLSSGWMVFTGTKATGRKARPGQSAGEHELVTLAWPVLLPEDVQQLAEQPQNANGKQARRVWLQQRLVRIIDYGQTHPEGPVLLTQADLAVMLGLTTVQVSQLLAEARQTTGKSLLTKGYYFDQGMRPTHKAEIIALYENGADEADIARQTGHAQTSVGRYIRDYERVKLMLTHNHPVERIGQLIGMQPGVVRAYDKLVTQYHPDLVSGNGHGPSQT